MTCRIASFELVAADADRLAAFYCGALGFRRDGNLLRLGAQCVRLVRADANARPYPADSTAADLWFQHLAIVTTDITSVFETAERAGAVAITIGGPQHLPRRSGGVTAWKFRDPEGHPLELLQFPAGRPPAAWAGRRGLHLGIDHSAISVADAETSITWYRDRFGFEPVSREMNWGAEQARLDGIAGARAEVVALEPPPGRSPPHLELLAYRPAGRPSPVRTGDIAATTLVVEGSQCGQAEATRDPDGHRIHRAPAPDDSQGHAP